jgi:hypothetical protein
MGAMAKKEQQSDKQEIQRCVYNLNIYIKKDHFSLSCEIILR